MRVGDLVDTVGGPTFFVHRVVFYTHDQLFKPNKIIGCYKSCEKLIAVIIYVDFPTFAWIDGKSSTPYF